MIQIVEGYQGPGRAGWSAAGRQGGCVSVRWTSHAPPRDHQHGQLSVYTVVALVAAISIVISLFIETSAWWIKAFCPPNRIGHFVARTNIYLYGSRMFSLLFSSGIAACVEVGESRWMVALLISASFAVALVSQVLLINRSRTALRTIELLARMIMLKERVQIDHGHAPVPNNRLTLATALGTYIFGLGVGLPLLLASLVPQHRLVISYSGQIINFAGSLTVIIYVDQTLFRSMDSGNIRDDVLAFTRGRKIGLFAISLTFGIIASYIGLLK